MDQTHLDGGLDTLVVQQLWWRCWKMWYMVEPVQLLVSWTSLVSRGGTIVSICSSTIVGAEIAWGWTTCSRTWVSIRSAWWHWQPSRGFRLRWLSQDEKPTPGGSLADLSIFQVEFSRCGSITTSHGSSSLWLTGIDCQPWLTNLMAFQLISWVGGYFVAMPCLFTSAQKHLFMNMVSQLPNHKAITIGHHVSRSKAIMKYHHCIDRLSYPPW